MGLSVIKLDAASFQTIGVPPMDGHTQQPPPFATGISYNYTIVGRDAGPWNGWTWANGVYSTDLTLGFNGISDNGSVIIASAAGFNGFYKIVNGTVQAIPAYLG